MENNWGQMTQAWMNDGDLINQANEISQVIHESTRSTCNKLGLAVACVSGLATGIGIACWLCILSR